MVVVDPLAWKAPEDARTRVPETPRALARLLALCLSLSPSQRPANAAALRHALQGLSHDPAPAIPGGTALARGAPGTLPPRRMWTGLALAAGALLAYLLLGGPLPGPSAHGARGVLLEEPHDGSPPSQPPRYEPVLAPRYAHSYALLIGIGATYAGAGWPALPNAERDVEYTHQQQKEIHDAPLVVRFAIPGFFSPRSSTLNSMSTAPPAKNARNARN